KTGDVYDLALAVQRCGCRDEETACGFHHSLARHPVEGGCALLASGPGMGVAARWIWSLRSRHQCAVDRNEDHAGADFPSIRRSLLSAELPHADCRVSGL